MLRKEIAKLIEDIFELSAKQGYTEGKRKRELAEKDPEASLYSLLDQIKKDLLDPSSTLSFTVEFGTFHVKESRQLLDQNKIEALAKS